MQDTTDVNYNSRQKMEGLGYISDKTIRVNIHSYLAVMPEGLVLGVLAQQGIQPEKNEAYRINERTIKEPPDSEKESDQWLTTMEQASRE